METANYYAREENSRWVIYWKKCLHRPLLEDLEEEVAKQILEKWEKCGLRTTVKYE